MSSEKYEKSNNQLPLTNDWHRYDCPTVLRQHGPEYLERFWRDGMSHRPKEPSNTLAHSASICGDRIFIELVLPRKSDEETHSERMAS